MTSLTLSSSTAMPMARQALTIFSNPFRKYTIPTFSFSHKTPKRHRFICQYTHSVSDPKPCIRSPEAIALEYSDLNLPHTTSEEVGQVRIRQHVNPLSTSFATPAEVPNWDEVYEDTKLPLMVDIGSGSGRFLMWLAKRNLHSKNYLGLEIRKKLAMRAKDWADELNLRNIHYMFANATISFKQLVSTYPGPLILVSILVFIQSDVLEVALDMRNHFDAESDTLTHVIDTDSSVLCDDDGWLLKNPMGIRTEREIHAELDGAKIYRRMYQKRI